MKLVLTKIPLCSSLVYYNYYFWLLFYRSAVYTYNISLKCNGKNSILPILNWNYI